MHTQDVWARDTKGCELQQPKYVAAFDNLGPSSARRRSLSVNHDRIAARGYVDTDGMASFLPVLFGARRPETPLLPPPTLDFQQEKEATSAL